MDTKFTYRTKGGPLRRPPRRRRTPWIIWVLLALALIVAVVFVIVKLTSREAEEEGAPEPSPPASLESPDPAAVPPSDPTAEPTASPAAPSQITPDSAPEDKGSYMTVGGSAYEYYQFDLETTNSYITAVSEAGTALNGIASLYHLVVPTGMDIELPDSYLVQYNVNSSDQRKAIDRDIYPSVNAMNASVKTIPLFDALLQHCNEYVYFRTDRTWTQLGAYYAYREFCQAKGFQPVSLDQLEKKSYEGFLGGFSEGEEDYSLISDTVDAYLPGGTTSLSFTDSNGESFEGWNVISDGEGYSNSLLYLIFAAGDQPYKVLENSDLTDNSACLVVQDSFGNFFIPFLTQHYQHVYVVDYQLYSGSVPQLAQEKGASDVIILNSIISTSSASGVESLKGLF